MNDKDLLKIIKHYGVMTQLKYFQSEIFELNEAIIAYENKPLIIKSINEVSKKLNDSYKSVDIEYIAEEIADVMVMLSQFKEYYGIDGNDIMRIMKEKTQRQLARIEKENKDDDR